jgi:hypothetical protein
MTCFKRWHVEHGRGAHLSKAPRRTHKVVLSLEEIVHRHQFASSLKVSTPGATLPGQPLEFSHRRLHWASVSSRAAQMELADLWRPLALLTSGLFAGTCT